MTRVYYKDAVGCLVVYDITRESTLDAVAKWKGDLDSKVQLPNGCRIPCVLLANKVIPIETIRYGIYRCLLSPPV
jgi:Ras-related protein Rab-32